jgi:type II restriction enzyme
MDLSLNTNLAVGYKSASQIARRLTEHWVLHQAYCPVCGAAHLDEFENNRPVADFHCVSCTAEFELKSKSGELNHTVPDGAYSTMIERIESRNNPHFFFLNYTKDWTVKDFLLVPNYFFTAEMIFKRKPLPETAKRAGWVGCDINIGQVPNRGRIFIIQNAQVLPKASVTHQMKQSDFIKGKSIASRGWLLDTMRCIDRIKKPHFKLDELYQFEAELRLKYPNNQHIKDKIRQQLQLLRDQGLIEFVARGVYRKVHIHEI